jgi:hypothetical protein
MDPSEQPRLDSDRGHGARLLRPADGGWHPVDVVVEAGALRVVDAEPGRASLECPLRNVVAVDAIGERTADGTEIEVQLDAFPPLRLRLGDRDLDGLLAALVASVDRDGIATDTAAPGGGAEPPGPDPGDWDAGGTDSGETDPPTAPATAARSRWSTLTAPRVWAGALALCIGISVLALLCSAVLRRSGGAASTAGALATVGAVYLGATACAFVGLGFSTARASTDARPGTDGAQSALFASAVLVLIALLTAGVIVSERIEPDLGFRTGPAEIRDTDVTTATSGSEPECPASPDADC